MKTPETIQFEYDGKSYTLGFNRKVCKQMERQGFSPARVTNAPVSTVIAFFHWSFVMHHKQSVSMEKAEEIYNHLENKDDLLDALIDLYNVPVNSLFEDPDDDAKKISWKRVEE